MTQSSRLTAELESPVLEFGSDNKPKVSILKSFREKKQISRSRLSRLTHLSSDQIKALEGNSIGDFMGRFLACVGAMGYKSEDVIDAVLGDGNAYLNGGIKPDDVPRGEVGNSLFK